MAVRMDGGDRGSRPRVGVKQRALAATGLVATAAAGGGLAVTAAEAQAASGVVHACYSKSTHALKYAKGSKCPKGSKSLSWNKKGSQGAAGAKGAQGATGATGPAVGWANEHYSSSPPTTFPANTPTVVADFAPTSAGYFAVNGFTNVKASGGSAYYWCWDQAGSGSTTNYTPVGEDYINTSRVGDIATGGIVAAGPTHPVYQYCEGRDSGEVSATEVTGIHLDQAHLSLAAKSRPGSFAASRNRFSKKK